MHIYNTAQAASSLSISPFEFVTSTDAVLLIENAVYNAVLTAENHRLLSNIQASVYALVPDLNARGFDRKDLLAAVNPVDYDGFVDLTAQFDVSMSW